MSMDDLTIPFINAKVVGTNIDGDAYRRQLPGIDRGHKDFVMSRSELMLAHSCFLRWVKGYNPKSSNAADTGSLWDCLLMDAGRFDAKFAKQPETCKATKTMQAVKDGDVAVGDEVPWSPTSKEARAWKAAQGDKIIVTPKESVEAEQAMSRLFGNEKIKALIQCSDFQVMVVAEYHDRATGLIIPMKALIDIVPRIGTPFARELADYKTIRNANPRHHVRAIDERNYDAQAAIFMDIYVAATGEDRNTFLHVVQESTFPFEPDYRMLSSDFLMLGRGKVISALRDYCQCLAANRWPSWSMDRLAGCGLLSPEPYMAGRYNEPLNLSAPDEEEN